jgi:hypothetical protein
LLLKKRAIDNVREKDTKKRIIGMGLVICLLLALLAGCTPKEPANQTDPTPTETQTEPGPAEDPNAQTDPTMPAWYANAPIKEVKTTQWESGEDGITLLRFAQQAADWTASRCGLGAGSEIVVTDVRKIEIGYAWDVQTSSHVISLYEVDYLVYGSEETFPYKKPTVSVVRATDGGFFSEEDAAKALLFRYGYVDTDNRSYQSALYFCSKADVERIASEHEMKWPNDPMAPYHTVAEIAYEWYRDNWQECEILQDQEGAHYLPKFAIEKKEPTGGEYALYAADGTIIAEPNCDEALADVFSEGRKEAVKSHFFWTRTEFLNDCTSNYLISYPGLETACDFSSLSARMIIRSLRVTRPDWHTFRGIAVGSTRAEVEQAYPEGLYSEEWISGYDETAKREYYAYDTGYQYIRFYFEGDAVSEVEITFLND